MTLDLPRPAWWDKDVPFDPTGETQLGWAKEAAAKYRAAAAKALGAKKAKDKVVDALKADMGVTLSVTDPESVTKSVTGVTDTVTGVTSVTTIISKKDKAAERTRRWREKNRAAKAKGRHDDL